MRGRLRAVQLACSLVAAAGAPAQALAADCPDEEAAGREAERAFKLRRESSLAAAVDAFEAAYRCMPRDQKHEARWEHLASYLETLQSLPTTTPADARIQLCRARAVIADYQQSIATVSPPPAAANYAGAEQQRIDEELARLGDDGCEQPRATPEPEPTTAPQATLEPTPPPVDRGPPARPLWIAGAVTGAASIIPFVVMGIGLSKGSQAEAEAADAMTAGELQQIRDSIHPDGVIGNRMAYAGAIVGGALLVTGVALLVSASRRARLGRARVSAAGPGLLVRF